MEIGSFGQWLKLRRQALRLTQGALAGMAFCSAELIRKVEADSRRPSAEVAELLARHLGLSPRQQATFVAVARAELPPDALPPPAEVAPPAARPEPAGAGLPAPAAPIVGRERELAELRALLLRPDVRLLTLVGAPGIGKTRLALEAAASARGAFADDACLVALAPLRDPALVADAAAGQLGAREPAGRPAAERLRAHLAGRQLLLVLDNFEHVAAAAPLVAEVLAAAPHVTALVTSRAALRISGEREYHVPPLAEAPAAELFLQRARAVAPGLELGERGAAAVAEVCRRLDGLPLAIELAAARTRLLPPEALLARLDRRLGILTGGALDSPPHQRALRATIDWSYGLLDERGRALLRGLAVFAGGCTIEAAEAVLGLAPDEALDGLSALLGHSLLARRDGPGGPRLAMLETIREYALERLGESGEGEALRRRHAGYYAALAERAAPHIWRSERGAQGEWLARLEAERDNLRAALDWAASPEGDAGAGLRAAAALWPLWRLRGQLAEGRARLSAALARPQLPGEPPGARSAALAGLGALACDQGDYGDARGALAARIELARAEGDSEGETSAAYQLGVIDSFQGDYAAARARIEGCLARWRAAGSRAGEADALQSLGDIAWHRGDYGEARGLQERSLALRRAAGDDVDVSAAGNLHNLGRLARVAGDSASAEALCRESLALARARGFQAGVVWALHDLGELARDRGDRALAEARFGEALEAALAAGSPSWPASVQNRMAELALDRGDPALAEGLHRAALRAFHRLGQRRDIMLCLDGLALVAEAQGQDWRAAALAGAAEALRDATGAQVPPLERARAAEILARARARLGAAAFDAARAAGRALPLAEAVALGMGEG